MISRKKKLRIIQLSLFLIGSLIILYTYINKSKFSQEKIITSEKQKKVKEQLVQETQSGDIFFNIEYSGLDLAGNRYILKSKEAFNDKSNKEIINMKAVTATFYFKDDTTLFVSSEKGIYNNNTLDMSFRGNVKAEYEGSELFAEQAEYSNSESYLAIRDKVKIKDVRGTMVADKLLFDIKKQKLNIGSYNDGTIKTNLNLK